MVKKVKIGILFASTSLLALMGGNSILAKPIEDQGKTPILNKNIYKKNIMNSQHTSGMISDVDKEEMKKKAGEISNQGDLLVAEMVRNPNEISKGDARVRKLTDKMNKFFYSKPGVGYSLDEVWSKLVKSAEKTRTNRVHRNIEKH